MLNIFHFISTPRCSGGTIVVADMAVSLASILTNLMVISAIRDTEAAANPTFNLVLANLCCANLGRAVLVKVAPSLAPSWQRSTVFREKKYLEKVPQSEIGMLVCKNLLKTKLSIDEGIPVERCIKTPGYNSNI